MSISSCFRGSTWWTHSKLIVGILFSFPERPRIAELLYFIGSVVAGKDTAICFHFFLTTSTAPTKPETHLTRTEPYPLNYLKTDIASTMKAGDDAEFDFFKLFWPCHVACRILAPQPGLEPVAPCSGNMKFQPLDWQGSPQNLILLHILVLLLMNLSHSSQFWKAHGFMSMFVISFV